MTAVSMMHDIACPRIIFVRKMMVFCSRICDILAILLAMDMDPHTLLQIIRRIEQQMRCPQCGKRIPVDFGAVRMAGEDFMLLQLKCDTCDAYIVLHAALQGTEVLLKKDDEATFINASSTLELKDHELAMLRTELEKSGGSFESMFKGMDQAQGTKIA